MYFKKLDIFVFQVFKHLFIVVRFVRKMLVKLWKRLIFDKIVKNLKVLISSKGVNIVYYLFLTWGKDCFLQLFIFIYHRNFFGTINRKRIIYNLLIMCVQKCTRLIILIIWISINYIIYLKFCFNWIIPKVGEAYPL